MPTLMRLFATKFNLLYLSQCLCPCLTIFFSFNCDVKDIQLCFQVVQVSIWKIVTKILQVFILVPSRLLKRIIFKKCFVIMKSISSKSRSSHQNCSVKKLFSKILQYSQEKRLQHRCFPVNNAKFLRTPVVKNICKSLRFTWFHGGDFKHIIWSDS